MSSFSEREDTAAAKVLAALSLPIAPERDYCGAEGYFDPWELFPSLYGSYSSAFDDMAIKVLENLRDGEFDGEGLAHEMFREILCTSTFCDYGTSPRVCFPNRDFHKMLPRLIEKWREYCKVWWGE